MVYIYTQVDYTHTHINSSVNASVQLLYVFAIGVTVFQAKAGNIAMAPRPKSCKGRIVCLVGVGVVVVVLVLPTILFYSWRDSDVNNWRSHPDLLKVYNHIHDCTNNVTTEENKTQVSSDLIQLSPFTQ